MERTILEKVVRGLDKDILQRPGCVFFTLPEKWRPGGVYLLGLNPGGDEKLNTGNEGWVGCKPNIFRTVPETEGARGHLCSMGCNNDGKAPTQLHDRILHLLEKIVKVNVEDACVSNLIFCQSKNQSELRGNIKKWVDGCWSVHRAVLEEIKPRVVITFGKTTYMQMLGKMKEDGRVFSDERTENAGWGNWKIRIASETDGVVVIGLPHLSWYTFDGEAPTRKKARDAVMCAAKEAPSK